MVVVVAGAVAGVCGWLCRPWARAWGGCCASKSRRSGAIGVIARLKGELVIWVNDTLKLPTGGGCRASDPGTDRSVRAAQEDCALGQSGQAPMCDGGKVG